MKELLSGLNSQNGLIFVELVVMDRWSYLCNIGRYGQMV